MLDIKFIVYTIDFVMKSKSQNAGESFILGTIHDGIALDDDSASIVTALNDLESLLVDPLSEDIDVEVFIASI